jgi:hypothetical protein
LNTHATCTNKQIAELLIEAGADKKAVNNKGQIPLDIAMEGTDPEKAKEMYLIETLQ